MESDPLRKWASRSHGSERLSGDGQDGQVRPADKSDQQMWSEYKDFDKNAYLLNFTKGTVDLRASNLRAHDQQDMISCLVPHTYNPYAQAPLWERLIYAARSATGAARPLSTCSESSGTCWSATTSTETSPDHRREADGKSKIVEICARLLGPDYAVISQSKLVTKSQSSTHHDSETWSIHGRRYVAISETGAGMDLDEAMVKNLASASTMAMRGLYRDKESQMPVTWTIIISASDEPKSRSWTTQLDGV